MTKPDFLKFGNGHKFEPEPKFYNHMCHWAPWADHFAEQEGDIGALALMLGSACEEIDRLRKRGQKEEKSHAELLFAFIEVVDGEEPKPFEMDNTISFSRALSSIERLNRWRKKNRLNIKAVDVI